RFLAEVISRLSRSRAARAIKAGGIVFSDGRPVKSSTMVREGDAVIVRESFEHEPVQYDEVVILEETPRFVAIDKPAGMVTHPTATAYRNTALLYLQLNGWPDAAVVHRID